MRKVIISVAPVPASCTEINPEAIAREVIDCSRAGVAMVHLHVRDEKGRLTWDLSLLRETVRLIRSECDIIIQASTGGVSNLTIEERCAPLTADWVEAVSLNVGSVNLGEAVYYNPASDVRYCVQKIIKNRKVPEIEVFELGMIKTVKDLDEKFHLPRPILFSVVLGHVGAAPATSRTLESMVGAIDEFFGENEAVWGITHAHRKDFDVIEKALQLGASTVRIGFEDSPYLDAEHVMEKNLPLVEQTVRLVRTVGLSVASAAEARKMLHICRTLS